MIFKLNKIETKRYTKWKKKHSKKCLEWPRVYTVSFTPGSIGTGISVKCSCGKNKDITDINSW